jgi:putative NIF3 family GTP cyclohydrolase 1 type 2
MLQAHPYEEAAYDLYPLRNPGQVQGLGRIGSLLEPVSPREFAEQVRKGLHADYVRLVQAGDQLVQKVALCSGSGAEFIGRAAGLGADAYVTGDVRYHEAQQAVQQGLHVIDAGHFSTEFPIVEVLARRLEAELQGQVKIAVDDFSQDFFQIIR